MKWRPGGAAHCNRRSNPTQSLIVIAKTLYSALQGKNLNVDAKMESDPWRKPGVACDKHQGREPKTSTMSFHNKVSLPY